MNEYQIKTIILKILSKEDFALAWKLSKIQPW